MCHKKSRQRRCSINNCKSFFSKQGKEGVTLDQFDTFFLYPSLSFITFAIYSQSKGDVSLNAMLPDLLHQNATKLPGPSNNRQLENKNVQITSQQQQQKKKKKKSNFQNISDLRFRSFFSFIFLFFYKKIHFIVK